MRRPHDAREHPENVAAVVVRHTGLLGNVAPMSSRQTPRRALRTTAFVCAAGLAAVACGGSSDSDSDSAADPAPAVTADDGAATPAEADGDVPGILQFSSALVGGGQLDAATLAGKPTAFWFWAPN